MPRYYFHVRDGDELLEDTEGAEVATVDDAVKEAILAAREILADKILKGEIVDGQRFEITDEEGNVVHYVPFKSTMRFD